MLVTRIWAVVLGCVLAFSVAWTAGAQECGARLDRAGAVPAWAQSVDGSAGVAAERIALVPSGKPAPGGISAGGAHATAAVREPRVIAGAADRRFEPTRQDSVIEAGSRAVQLGFLGSLGCSFVGWSEGPRLHCR